MKRSATSADTIEKALSQPNSRSDGRSENTVTTSPQASTSVVRISAGPTSTVARSTASSGVTSAVAIERATILIGPALILTTVVLACGLVVTVFSDLPSLRLFGWLSAFSMVAALVADLFILRPTAMWLINLSERLRGGKSGNALG